MKFKLLWVVESSPMEGIISPALFIAVNSKKVIKDKVKGVFCLLSAFSFSQFCGNPSNKRLAAGIPIWQPCGEWERANENRAYIASIEDAHRAFRGLLHNTSNLSPLCSLMREKLSALVVPPVLSGLRKNNTLAQSRLPGTLHTRLHIHNVVNGRKINSQCTPPSTL